MKNLNWYVCGCLLTLATASAQAQSAAPDTIVALPAAAAAAAAMQDPALPPQPNAVIKGNASTQVAESFIRNEYEQKLEEANQDIKTLRLQRLILLVMAGLLAVVAAVFASDLLRRNRQRKENLAKATAQPTHDGPLGPIAQSPASPNVARPPASPPFMSQNAKTLAAENDRLLDDFKRVRAAQKLLAEQNLKLQTEIEQLHREREAGATTATGRAGAAGPAMALAATPGSSVSYFAEMPENRRLEHLHPDSGAYRPILVRLPADPAAAEALFEFNPSADQYFFTHNGMYQLHGTFSHAVPNWSTNPQTIRTLAPGRLRRDGTGWLVVAAAQIEIY